MKTRLLHFVRWVGILGTFICALAIIGGFSSAPFEAFDRISRPDDLRKIPIQAPTVISSEHSFKSFDDLQAYGQTHDRKLAEFASARQLKDPTQAPSLALQWQAVAGKLDRLYHDPQYQGLSEYYKGRVRGAYWTKFAKPLYDRQGIEPPTEERWVAGFGTVVGGEPVSYPGLFGTWRSGAFKFCCFMLFSFGVIWRMSTWDLGTPELRVRYLALRARLFSLSRRAKEFLAVTALLAGGLILLASLAGKVLYIEHHTVEAVIGIALVASGLTFLWNQTRFHKQ